MVEAPDRRCGTCFACCVALGIRALQKLGGQSCRHLDGRNPEGRCSIYARRPEACAEYLCAWRRGLGEDEMLRPDKSGVLATLYADEQDPTKAQATVHVLDPLKAGNFNDPASPLHTVIEELFGSTIVVSIVLVLEGLRPKRPMLHFRDGEIFRGEILPSQGYEDLSYATMDERIGTYAVRRRETT